MKNFGFLSLLIFLSACNSSQDLKVERLDAGLDVIIDKNPEIKIIASGFTWCEGPLWLADSSMLLFSDVPQNIIYSWFEKGGLSKYLTPSGYTETKPREGEKGSNGLALSADGRLLICQHGNRAVAVMNSTLSNPIPDYTVLADNINGKKLNSPNDLALRSNGDIYFTDPPFGLPGLDMDSTKEIPFNGVYKISNRKAVLLVDTISKPNGIAFLPNHKTFIVANSDAQKPFWYAFDIDDNDSIYNARIFYNATNEFKLEGGGPDGLKVDRNGNVFATGPGGIWIFNMTGKVLGKIKIKGAVSNCALADDEKTLFVTNGMNVLRIKLRD